MFGVSVAGLEVRGACCFRLWPGLGRALVARLENPISLNPKTQNPKWICGSGSLYLCATSDIEGECSR